MVEPLLLILAICATPPLVYVRDDWRPLRPLPRELKRGLAYPWRVYFRPGYGLVTTGLLWAGAFGFGPATEASPLLLFLAVAWVWLLAANSRADLARRQDRTTAA